MNKLCIKCGRNEIYDTDLQLCMFCRSVINRLQENLEKAIAEEPMSNERAILILKNYLGIAPNEELDNEDDWILDDLLDIAMYTAVKALEKGVES